MKRGECVKGEDDTLKLSATKSARSKGGPASSQVGVEIAGITHRGHVRENNEDHYLAVRFHRSLKTLCTNLEENTIAQARGGPGLEVARHY